MNILYVALRESLPGSHGGAVHVFEVARQLARRGHRLTVVVKQEPGQALQETQEGFDIVRLRVPSKYLLFTKAPELQRLIHALHPDVIMERYYNFAGGGIASASASGIPSLLEVNAPLLDPPGTTKAIVDRLLLGWMKRRALSQAQNATRIVTPLAATIPSPISRDKIREIQWGANVEMFDRAALDPRRLADLRSELNPQSAPVVLFLGSFRRWHGVTEFVNVAREIARSRENVLFLIVGSGEMLDETRRLVSRSRLERQIILTGAVRYEQVPYYLALSDIGVAPFNTSVHAPLRVGFYWSPLKIHEYMAMALPVVTIDVHPLNQIVRPGQEGLLYPEADSGRLKANIESLLDDPALARRLGQAGRHRVVECYSWQKHAEHLEAVLMECIQQMPSTF